MFLDRPVAVRVPGSAANLGPGFDTLGLAVAMYDELVLQARPCPGGTPGHTLAISGEGAEQVSAAGEAHLVLRSMRTTFTALGVPQPTVELTAVNRVPHGRGLGSSAAAVVAGVVGARALVRDGVARMGDEDALTLAADLEGHPDNVAPSLLGGLTLAWTEGSRSRAVRLVLDPRVRPVAYVPAHAASTKVARGVLPGSVPFGDAVRQLSRVALLVEAMRGRPELLLAATEDRLHQPYRAASMPASAELVARLRSAGHAAVVSGAGPSVLVLTTRPAACPPPPGGWRRLDLDVDVAGATAGAPARAS